MPVESIVNSFSSGELSPSVFGRTDIPQYQRGAASLKNMLVLPSGSARKRPGTQLLDTLVNTTEITTFGRLGAFQMGAEVGQAILITKEIIRSYTSAGSVGLDTTPPVTVTDALVKSLRSVQTKLDAVYVSRGVRPYRITNAAGSLGSPSTIPIQEPSLKLTFDVIDADALPGAIAAVDERIVFGGTNDNPNAIFGSAIKALDDYIASNAWTSSTGTVTLSTGETGVAVKAGNQIPSGATSPSGITSQTDMNFFANSGNSDDQAAYAFLVMDNAFIDIYWMTATSTLQNGFLIVGTSEGVYALVGSGENGAIIPSGLLTTKRLSSSGCSKVQGIFAGNYLVFVDASKRKVRVAQFTQETDQFNTPSLTDLADHLFDADIKEIHYQRAPNSVLWVLLENGKLLAFSYDASGTLSAWTPMEFGTAETTVTVESMTVLHEGAEDVIILLMKSVFGSTTTWTVEKMMPLRETDQDEFWFVDSGKRQYNATAFTVVTGLSHLEGETVKIWADGGAHPDRVVASGQITLNRAVNTAIVGRAYTAVVQTLPIQSDQEKIKRASRGFVRFLQTIGAKAGGDFTEVIPFMEGDFEMGAKPSAFSGIKEFPYRGRHEREADITVFSDAPTPFHVLSVTTRLEIYG